MMAALAAGLAGAAQDNACRVVIIAATGPVFSSGHNLKQLTARRNDPDRGAAYFAAIFRQCSDLMLAIMRHPKPVIAEVQGMASAAGCQLVASCDLAVAADHATFCTPVVNIGLFCSTPMVALSRNLSRKNAMAMLLTGDTVTAAEALRLGLVNSVVPPAELPEASLDLARRIASKSRATVRIGKEAFYNQVEMPVAEAYAYAAQVMTENMLARDAEEGIGAFIAKRQPRWEDR
jgi:enoyl-CoA hydratase/carnithine racemase